MTTRFCQRLMMVATLGPLLLLAGQLRAQSALDGFDPNANVDVWVVATQPDGKILIGGDFSTISPNGGPAVTRNGLARLNPDGTLDTAFNPDVNSRVLAIAVQADGKILIGGGFFTVAGQTRNCIARLDATTGLPDSFNPNASGTVFSIALQADGGILAGGSFNSIGGQTRQNIARLDPATGLADSFDPSANFNVYSIVVQGNGKILVGGGFNGANSIGGQARFFIARLDPATGLADSFNPNANGPVQALAVQADGQVLASGIFTHVGGQNRSRIARLDATTGSADSFDPHASGVPSCIVVQPDGKILVSGYFSGANSIGGQTRNHIARLDPTTGLADSFDPNASIHVYSVAVQLDGKVLAAGQFTTLAPNGGATVTRNRIARLEKDGRLDQTLNANVAIDPPNGGVLATATQPDGKIVIGGVFLSVLGVERHNIARLNTDGSLDLAFNPDATNQVNAIAIQDDGKVVVGGNFTTIGGQTRHRLARLDALTGQADSFDPDAGAQVSSLAIQADGKILAAGSFNNIIGGQLRRFLARFDGTTGLADSFNPDPSNTVASIAIQPDGKILVGGSFVQIGGGQNRNGLARLDPATGLVDSFDAQADAGTGAIALHTVGRIVIAGAFTTIAGQARHFFALVEGTAGLPGLFDPNPQTSGVSSIGVQADGRVLAGGCFDSIGGQPRHRLARLDDILGQADSFDANPNPAGGCVSSTAIQADGKILAGGDFSGPNSIGGQSRDFFARLSNDTAALQNLVVTQTMVNWTLGGSSPQFTRVTFEFSNDNVSYTFLGPGGPNGNNWTLMGLNLPTNQNFYIRARGRYRSGQNNGSESIMESVRLAFLAGPPVTPTPTPTPTATPTPSPTPTPTPSPTPTPTPTPSPSTLGNISTRLRVQTGANVLIGGMIATGTADKRVILRALGPSLSGLGIPGALANPTLELFQGNTLLASNDDWRNSPQQAEIEASGFAPSNDAESAIIWTLTPGQGYTAIVRGVNGTTGVGVVEAFDLDHAAASMLGNISTRGFVEVDDNVMIAGLIVGPGNGTSARILARALGPTLSHFGVPDVLANPTLDLVNSSGTVIRANDNWKDDPLQRAEIEAAGLAPTDDAEAALVETVAPGGYTAVVRGNGRTTGVGLVEVYHLQ